MTNLEKLLHNGWNEGWGGGMLISTNPITGGIIDSCIKDSLWFVIFNGKDLVLEGFETRDIAIDAYYQTMNY